MYRVLFVLSGGLLLAACSSTPDWMSLDTLKPAPLTESVQFESEPAGATATLSSGQNCKTPCSVAVAADKPFSVTFSLAGYQPDTEQVEAVAMDGTVKLRPNPVLAELIPAPQAPKPAAKKPAKKKTSAAKPKPATKPTTTAAAPAPAPTTSAAAPAGASSWPTPPTQKQ